MVSILDTTLREGEQTPGVYFSEHVKLDIARQLNNVGVKFIEAGHPFVGQEIYDAVKHLAQQPFRSLVGAHSRSLRKDVDLALECGVKFLGVFYCVSDERLQTVFNTNLSSAINQIIDVIAYAKSQNPELIIRFTPEDTVRSAFQNVIDAAVASVQAGADIISVADTTGFMVPRSEHNMYDFVKRLKDTLARYDVHPSIAVHCHNDRGLALANALDGYFAGAEIIDASVLGLGERAGIVDLATLTAMLVQLENEHESWDLKQLVPLYQMVSKFAQVPIPVNFPVTGENAFKHCAGVHTHAAQVNPLHYQSLDPAPFGRQMEIALDHMSGISSLRYALYKIGVEDLDKKLMNMVLSRVKEVGRTGRTVALDELSMIVHWVKEKQKVEESTRKVVNFES
jgi:2-isopropylmalate synthase